MTHRTIARIGRAEREGTQFRFPMTLASEGEASDGHILSIAGGEIPDRMPLLVSHFNDPESQVGSITGAEKRLKDSPPVLTAEGHIELGGEGDRAESRRDLAHMIEKEHVSAVSIRWNGSGPGTRRVDLPSDHPAHVSADDHDHAGRFGIFFDRWRAMEGSIVAVGADQLATIGQRAAELRAEGRVDLSAFWLRMLEPVPEEPSDKEAALSEAIKQIVDGARTAVEHSVPPVEVVAGVAQLFPAFEPIELANGEEFFVPREIVERLRVLPEGEMPTDDEAGETPVRVASETPDPAPVAKDYRLTREDIFAVLREGIQAMRQDQDARIRKALYEALGRV